MALGAATDRVGGASIQAWICSSGLGALSGTVDRRPAAARICLLRLNILKMARIRRVNAKNNDV